MFMLCEHVDLIDRPTNLKTVLIGISVLTYTVTSLAEARSPPPGGSNQVTLVMSIGGVILLCRILLRRLRRQKRSP